MNVLIYNRERKNLNKTLPLTIKTYIMGKSEQEKFGLHKCKSRSTSH